MSKPAYSTSRNGGQTMNIMIKTVSGEQETDAFPCGILGLVIHKAQPGFPGWVITHLRSGYAVGWFPDGNPESTLACARELGELQDWTADGVQLAALGRTAAFKPIRDCLRRWGYEPYENPLSGDKPADINPVPGGAT